MMTTKTAIVGHIDDSYVWPTLIDFKIAYEGNTATKFSIESHIGAERFLTEMLRHEENLQVGHRVLIRRAIAILLPLPQYETDQWWAKNTKEANTMASVFTMKINNSTWEDTVTFKEVSWEYYNQLLQDEIWEQTHPYPY